MMSDSASLSASASAGAGAGAAGFAKNARVSTYGFSKPTVITKNGSASESRIGSTGMRSMCAVTSAKKKANVLDSSTHVPSQKPDGNCRIDRYRCRKEPCIRMYAPSSTVKSMRSALEISTQSRWKTRRTNDTTKRTEK